MNEQEWIALGALYDITFTMHGDRPEDKCEMRWKPDNIQCYVGFPRGQMACRLRSAIEHQRKRHPELYAGLPLAEER